MGDYDASDDIFAYDGGRGRLWASGIILGFLLFFGLFLVKYVSYDMVVELQVLTGVGGLVTLGVFLKSLQPLMARPMTTNTHDFAEGDVIEVGNHFGEVISIEVMSVSLYDGHSSMKHSVPHSYFEDRSVIHHTPSGYKLGLVGKKYRAFKRSFFIDIMWDGTMADLRDMILNRVDKKGTPLSIANWTGLLAETNYAGLPTKDAEGNPLVDANNRITQYDVGFDTTFKVIPPNRDKYHATTRIEFFFNYKFAKRGKGNNSYWDTYGELSDFGVEAMVYFASKKVKVVAGGAA